MTRRLRDLPVRLKLRYIVLTVSMLSVVGACTVFVSYQWLAGKSGSARQLALMASIVADQCSAAVEFEQPDQADAILRALKAEHQYMAAAVYDRDGKLFARYERDPGLGRIPARPGPDGTAFEAGELRVFQPMLSEGQRIGTFYLRSDMASAWRRLQVNLLVVAVVLAGAVLISLLLTRWMGRLVTEPVTRLAAAVGAVSAGRDYSMRVAGESRDELGRLIEGFNHMLAAIEARDQALAKARDQLEARVQERTRELREEVAERKAAEQRLQDKDARLTEAQEIAQLGSWEWALDGGRVTWSDEVYRTYGLLPSGFGGGHEDFVRSAHPDDRDGLRRALETVNRKREPMLLDYRIIRPNGAVRYLHAIAKPVLDEQGRVLRVVGTLQDITDRTLQDQAIQELNRALRDRMAELGALNKELEAFSYSVSHDLRAPLRAIIGYAKMLLEDQADRLDPSGRRHLEVIAQSGRKMGRLIDDLLAFSRMGRKAVERRPVSLRSLIEEVFGELKAQAPDRVLDLRLGDLPEVAGDPAMLRQVVVNLLSNAVKYSRGRDPAVIEVGARTEAGETVYFVKDNGVGFEMQYASRLFGVFQRLHSEEDFEGTGVGLALVQRIVERHGGRVWAEGVPDRGATFFFTLPLPAATPAAAQA